MEHIDLANCILVSFCNEYDDDDQPLLKIGYERWLGDVDVHKLIKKKDITKILWPDIAITNKSGFKKQLKKANFEEKLVQVLALGDSLWSVEAIKKNWRKKSQRLGENSQNEVKHGKVWATIPTERGKKNTHEEKISPVVSKTKVTIKSKSKNKKDVELGNLAMDTDTNRVDSYQNDENYILDDDDDDDDNNANFNDKSNNPHWDMTIDPANSDTDVLSSDLSRSNELKRCLEKQNPFVMETNDIIRENEELKQKLKFASEGLSKIKAICDKYSFQLETANSLPLVDCSNSQKRKTGKRYKDSEEAPTNYVIDPEVMKRVPTQGSLASFTNAILDILFTPEELGASSPTGLTSNANIALGRAARPALERDRFNAARNMCMKYYGKMPKWQTAFMRVAGSKCSSYRRT